MIDDELTPYRIAECEIEELKRQIENHAHQQPLSGSRDFVTPKTSVHDDFAGWRQRQLKKLANQLTIPPYLIECGSDNADWWKKFIENNPQYFSVEKLCE